MLLFDQPCQILTMDSFAVLYLLLAISWKIMYFCTNTSALKAVMLVLTPILKNSAVYVLDSDADGFANAESGG